MDRRSRPKVTSGPSYKRSTGCGSVYVTVGCEPTNGRVPLEVFVRLGKAGGCADCQNQALGRAISIGLQYGVPIEDYIGTLLGIKCPNPSLYPEEEASLSCSDAVAKSLKEYMSDR